MSVYVHGYVYVYVYNYGYAYVCAYIYVYVCRRGRRGDDATADITILLLLLLLLLCGPAIITIPLSLLLYYCDARAPEPRRNVAPAVHRFVSSGSRLAVGGHIV